MFDPVWNKRIEESDRALDPLGMNRVNDRFLNDLLSGITTVTPRARYCSFYVWAVNESGKSANRLAQFKKKFYDLERLFMMSCLAHEQSVGRDQAHMNINGSDKGRRVWGESNQRINMDFRFFGNNYGGYGQYYQGAIARLGLTTMSENALFEQPSDLGKKVCRDFERVAKDSGFKDLTHKDKASKEELKKCGKYLCLCTLKLNTAFDRQSLREVFIPSTNLSEISADYYRQQTLALILLCCGASAKHNYLLNDQRFLDACYYGQIGDKKIFPIIFNDIFTQTVLRWKIFRAHDYLAYSAEAILSQFLSQITGSPTGATADDFLKVLTSNDSFMLFKDKIHLKEPVDDFSEIPLNMMLDVLSKAQGLGAFTSNSIEISKLFDKSIKLNSSNCERNELTTMEQYFKDELTRPELTVASWLTLLAFVYERFLWYHETKQKQWGEFLVKNTNLSRGLSPATFVDSYKKLVENDASVLDFIKWFVEEYVIEQAKRVYEDKSLSFQYKPKCWFHREEDRYIKDRDYLPGHRNSRFESAINILEDLGLVISNYSTIDLSADGIKELQMILGGTV